MTSNFFNIKIVSISVFLCSLLFSSCRKQVSDETGSNKQSLPDVYVAGGERDGNNSVAKYWNNGLKLSSPVQGPWKYDPFMLYWKNGSPVNLLMVQRIIMQWLYD